MSPTTPDEPRFLFAYGTLGPAFARGKDAGPWEADALRGRLYDLGPYPILVDLGDPTADWVDGHVRPTDATELREVLDPYEGVGDGPFLRTSAVSRDGRSVWVYVYEGPRPQYARGPLTRWEGPSEIRP